MHLDIKDDAIFIADSHYSKNRIEFELFLDDIISKKIKTSQLFLMGDMFDFLSSYIKYFININQSVIDKINIISLDIQIIYLEGNHDFNLQELFPNVNVIKRENQPLIIKNNNQKIAISHGDIFTPSSYNVYTKIIRNSYILKLLNFLDINNMITKNLELKLINKDICNKLNNFNKFAIKRIEEYSNLKVDIIIEGHYHQGKSYEKYINIPSFACSNLYTNIKDIID